MATKPFNIPNNFASEGTGTPNNIPLLDANFTAAANFNNDGSFFTMQGTDTGSANTYLVTMPSGYIPTAYNKGTSLYFYPANTNTGPSTINVNSVGTVNIRRADTSVLLGGEIQAGRLCPIIFDGTQFVLYSGSGAGTVAYYDYDDLVYFPVGTVGAIAGYSKLLYFAQGSGGTGQIGASGTNFTGHPGVAFLSSGTTVAHNTFAVMAGGNTQNGQIVIPDTFTWTIRAIVRTENTLSVNALLLGFTDHITTPISSGVNYVGFNGSSSSGFWTMVSGNGVSTTTTNSTQAIASATWYDLMMVFNANSSLATFYVNGSQVGTLSGGTLPATSAAMTPGILWQCNISSNTICYVDTFEIMVTGIPQLGTLPRFLHGLV